MTFTLNGTPLFQEEPAGETGQTTEEEEHNPILPEFDELLWGSIAFLLVFIVLWRFAFPRIGEMLQARTEKIQGEMENAEETRREADRVLAEYRQQLAGARDEANGIIEEARRTAEQLRKDLQDKAEREARSTVQRAQEEIRAERDRVMQELKAQVGTLSVQLAERVVGASLDGRRHRQLIDSYIDEVAATGSRNGDGDGSSGSSGGSLEDEG
jgi:F-type H+-transporting ATPase subunit b